MRRRWLPVGVLVLLVCSSMSLHAQEAQAEHDLSARAQAFYVQAQVRFEAGDYKEAHELFEQALALFQRLPQPEDEMRTVLYLGHCSYLLWDYYEALNWYEPALGLARLVAGPRNVAVASESLGVCYQALGDYVRAIGFYDECLAIFRAIGDRASEAESLRRLGQCYSALGDHEEAIAHHRGSLGISREVGSWWGVARSLMELGGCYLMLGEYPQAVDWFTGAVVLIREIGHRRGEAQALAALGLTYQALGNYGRAIELHDAALAIFRGIADQKGEAESLMALSDCHYALGQHLEAARLCQEALMVLRTIEDRWGEAEVRLRLAKHLGALGNFHQVVEVLEQAIDTVESLCPAPEPALRRVRMLLYEYMIQALFDLGELDEALLCSERAKDRGHVDMLETSLATEVRSLPEALGPVSRAVQNLAGLHRALRAPVFDLGRPATWPGFAEAIREAEEAYRAALGRLERDDPGLGRMLSTDPGKLRRQLERTRTWVEDGVAVVAYFVSDDATFAWLITAGGVQTAARIPIGRDELRVAVTEFREVIGSPPAPGREMAGCFEALERGSRLYGLLVAPLEEALEDARHLVIVPSDVLFSLSFSALYRCPSCEDRALFGGEFLVERHSVSYAPNLASLALPAICPSEGPYRSVLALDPTDGPSFAGEEARRVAALFPEGTVLEGLEATEAQVKTRVAERRCDVVSVAGGCLTLDVEDPLRSGITLWGDEGEDGVLRVGELLELKPAVDLLVLSTSLWTSRDEPGGGSYVPKGELGLAVGGVLSSGIGSVVLALGIVSDLPTLYLMEAMYRELLDGRSKGEALQQAQRALLTDETGFYRHPYYWAPFVLYGDWRGGTSEIPPPTGKLAYELCQRLKEWKRGTYPPGETSPVLSVLVTLFQPATEEDLVAIRAVGGEVVVQGAFGCFVQVRLPLELVEALAGLPQVRMIALPPRALPR